MNTLTDPVSDAMTRLKFAHRAELLLIAPSAYADFTAARAVLPPPSTARQFLRLCLVSFVPFAETGERSSLETAARAVIRFRDQMNKTVDAVVFHSLPSWAAIEPGTLVDVTAVIRLRGGVTQLTQCEPVDPTESDSVKPLYQGKQGQIGAALITTAIRLIVSDAAQFNELLNVAGDMILSRAKLSSTEFLAQTGYRRPTDLLSDLHQPLNISTATRALAVATRLAALTVVREAVTGATPDGTVVAPIPIDDAIIASLKVGLSFTLTAEQELAIAEIVSDLRGSVPMRRVLTGDVGTGKSITYMLPAAAAYCAGANVAIIAPSAPLVGQLVREFRSHFNAIPVTEVVAGRSMGEGVAIGTTALLFAAAKAGKQFEFVIADEQHRFGKAQREALASRHVLEATATPIPRTMALIKFGGIRVSTLTICPHNKDIRTHVVSRDFGRQLVRLLDEEIRAGRQVAIVYPIRQQKASDDRHSAEAAFLRFRARWGAQVGFLHGGLTDDEKTTEVGRMANKQTAVLIATSIIELGLTLPSLSLMVVVNPDRFGLIQLHQLRGRLARHGGIGHLYLYSTRDISVEASRRLTALVGCTKGLELAALDASYRGFGDVGEGGLWQKGRYRPLFWGMEVPQTEVEQEARKLGLLSV